MTVLRCHCGETFTGWLAGFLLAAHQREKHPGNPNNV